MHTLTRLPLSVLAALLAPAIGFTPAAAAPKAVLISLDGASPRFVDAYLADGTLNPATGIGRVKALGLNSKQNFVISPSLTAASHVAIATGSIAAKNDVVANSYHLVSSAFGVNVSGFGAPIGGYIPGNPPAEATQVTAEPLWIALRAAGKTVVAATFPGADGVNVLVPSHASPVVQPAAERTVDVTVPFGASAAPFQKGFTLNAANFAAASQATTDALVAVGRPSFSTVRQATLETFNAGGQSYTINAAAYDSTDDAVANYDTIVLFNQAQGITAGPFALPSTGPAYIRPATKISSPFYLEGHTNKAGTRYFVTQLAPDLSTVRLARTTTTFIPRNAAVLADVDDINNTVGFWQPQPDFRIVERLDATPSTFATFPDIELEQVYMELVREFTTYQARVAIRGIQRLPDADLVMTYLEQPDGSFHQFLLTDPRQPTEFTNNATTFGGQDAAKIARYTQYRKDAYRAADAAVEQIIQAAGGVDAAGRPVSNIFIVSDHGFAPFHSAVNMNRILANAGFNTNEVRAVTSGPAVNIYINLTGREKPGVGTPVAPDRYRTLQAQVVATLQAALDANPAFTQTGGSAPLFDKIYTRPLPASDADASFGLGTSPFIGQDSGDVYALLNLGYNFDGAQNPIVNRTGEAVNATAVLTQPNFYGAHGYDPLHPEMSAIFYAAGPDISQGTFASTRNIDIAPTLCRLLGVTPSPLVDGIALTLKSTGPVFATDSINLTRGGLVFQRATQRFVQTLTLKNTALVASTAPLYLILDGLSTNATLFGAAGATANTAPLGSPYLAVPLPGGTLAPGASVNLTLQFTNPTRAAITYVTRVAGPATP